MKPHKSIFTYIENELDIKPRQLKYRFPIETLGTLIKKFFKGNEDSSFLVKANADMSKLKLKKLSNSYLLEVPVQSNSSEQLYIGLSDLMSFLVLFDEKEENQKKEKKSKFYLTFEREKIKSIFDFFYQNYCSELSDKEKTLLLKLKDVKVKELSLQHISKFQEALLVDTLRDNNKANEQRLIDVLSFTNEAMIITDLDGNIKESNKEFEKTFKNEEAIKTVRDILSHEIVSEFTKHVMIKRSWQSEVELKMFDGEPGVFLVNCYLSKDEVVKENRYVFTFKDVTSLRNLDYVNKQLISKLREKNLELTDVNRRLLDAEKIRTELLSVVSHEMKTPMSTIIGFSELISKGWSDYDTIKTYAEQINLSGKTLNKILCDYLDVVTDKFGTDSSRLSTEYINLGELIRLAFQEVRSKYSDRDFKLDLSSVGYDSVILSERSNMKKLFSNIVDNALKYSPEGGTVSVKLLNDGDKVTISIADEGVGIDVEKAKYIFKPFYRTDNSLQRQFSGTGLGLAICKKISSLYGGSVWCEPGIDKGTIFYVTLPVNPNTLEQKELIKDVNPLEDKVEINRLD